MNVFGAFALGGAQGAAGKYNQIQDEQRKYNIKQKELQAQETRKMNFARFDYKLRDQYSGSGMVDESGREVTKGEASALEGLQPKRTYDLNEKQKQQDIKDAKKEEVWQAHEAQRNERKDEETAAKAEITSAKEDKKYVKDIEKKARAEAKSDENEGKGADVVAILRQGEIENDDRFFNSPAYKHAAETKRNSEMFESIFNENKGLFKSRKKEIEQTRKALKEKGATALELDDAEAYLDYYGILD